MGTFWEHELSKQIEIHKIQTQRENLQVSVLVRKHLKSRPHEMRLLTIQGRMPRGMKVQVLSLVRTARGP
jgi:hypothetical protein